MIKILKKNGSEQAFNGEKIKRAIQKSAARVCAILSEKEENKVVNGVRNQLKYNETAIPVDTIHNMVEHALDEINPDIAKSYREYRDNRKAWSAMLDRVYSKKLSLNFIGDRSNANSDSALVTTQKAIVYNELNSELYKKFFLTVKEEKAMSDGYIYIHDRGSRLDTINCCLFDMETLLKDGFFMGNLDYSEPKSLDVAFDLIGDVTLNAASFQYGGFTIPEVDKLLAPYAEKSYNLYYNEYVQIAGENFDPNEADKFAFAKVKREYEQGFQSWEMKFNSVASSRGDYPFTALTFGLGKSRFETLCSSCAMKVRKEGQGKSGFKHPVLFPKLSFFYDEEIHGEGKEFEWLFLEAIDCSSKSMYPDFISVSGDGYAPSIYKKYGIAISRMGCRANLSPWFKCGGMEPADENDTPVYNGRFNLGAISLNFPMIAMKAKKEDRDFFEILTFYLDMSREIHKRTFDYISHKKAGINPLGFCQNGFFGGNKDPDEELGEDFLRPMTLSFGIMGLNEASVVATGKHIHEDNSWAVGVMEFINEYANKYKKEDNLLYAIYGTPGESLCHTQIEQFRKKYGIVKDVSDHEYTTNSFHCNVRANITPIEKQDAEYPLFHLCNGGNIQYVRYRLPYNKEAMITLVRRAMKMGFYEGVNYELNWCEKCGHSFVDSDNCPKCGSSDITRVERMNGYLSYSNIRGKTMYSDHKLKEFKERVSM
jgi:ribonucleoside-triphosphate reductase